MLKNCLGIGRSFSTFGTAQDLLYKYLTFKAASYENVLAASYRGYAFVLCIGMLSYQSIHAYLTMFIRC